MRMRGYVCEGLLRSGGRQAGVARALCAPSCHPMRQTVLLQTSCRIPAVAMRDAVLLSVVVIVIVFVVDAVAPDAAAFVVVVDVVVVIPSRQMHTLIRQVIEQVTLLQRNIGRLLDRKHKARDAEFFSWCVVWPTAMSVLACVCACVHVCR